LAFLFIDLILAILIKLEFKSDSEEKASFSQRQLLLGFSGFLGTG